MASLNEKIACLGTKHDLEEDKARIMDTLTDINLVNFNNVERYNKNGNHEVLQAFLKLVNDNIRFSAKSEVIANLNANINRIDGASAAATMVKEMITELRDICTKASDRTIVDKQRDTLSYEFKGMLRQAFQIQNDCKFNGMRSLPHMKVAISAMPASSATMGKYNNVTSAFDGTGTWSKFARDVSGVDNSDTVATYQKGKWKAQIGFDTASTLEYDLYFWGPKFIMDNANHVDDAVTKKTTGLQWLDTSSDHANAEKIIDPLQGQEALMESKISGYDAVHDYLVRQTEVCELECEAALFSIESQRSEAKSALEEELQNLIRQQEYLNAVCAYRPM